MSCTVTSKGFVTPTPAGLPLQSPIADFTAIARGSPLEPQSGKDDKFERTEHAYQPEDNATGKSNHQPELAKMRAVNK